MHTIEQTIEPSPEVARCGCDSVELKLSGNPLFRGYCHCTTCQAYTGNAYSDVTVFRAADVSITNESTVAFKSYQKPSLVQRGTCTSCQTRTHEKVSMPALTDLIIVSTDILPTSLVLTPSMHIFYHRRVKDIADNVPKHSGFVKSQTAFMGALFKSLWRSRKVKAA